MTGSRTAVGYQVSVRFDGGGATEPGGSREGGVAPLPRTKVDLRRDLPGVLKIGALRYGIVLVDDEEMLGQHDYGQGVIILSQRCSPEIAPWVLFHEILHAVFDFCGLEQDEGMVQALAHTLLTVLRENPRITAFLLGEAGRRQDGASAGTSSGQSLLQGGKKHGPAPGRGSDVDADSSQ